MKLTSEQKAALTILAKAHGMRVLVTGNQVGIGYPGQFAFEVVYSPGARKGQRWTIRNRKERLSLAQSMQVILTK